jgi:hypothetical protein
MLYVHMEALLCRVLAVTFFEVTDIRREEDGDKRISHHYASVFITSS